MKSSKVVDWSKLPVILTSRHMEDIVGLSRVGTLNLMKRKDFPSIRIGRRIVVPRDALLRWLEQASHDS